VFLDPIFNVLIVFGLELAGIIFIFLLVFVRAGSPKFTTFSTDLSNGVVRILLLDGISVLIEEDEVSAHWFLGRLGSGFLGTLASLSRLGSGLGL